MSFKEVKSVNVEGDKRVGGSNRNSEKSVHAISNLASVEYCIKHGLNLHRREDYLSDADIELVFKVKERSTLKDMPEWKRNHLKRAHGLF